MVPLTRLVQRVPARLVTKFIAASIVISALFLSLSVYSVDASRHSMEVAIGQESIDLANQFALSVDRGVYTKLHELAIIALGRAIEENLVASNAEFDAMDDPEAYIDATDAEWTSVPVDEVTPFMEAIMSNELSLDLTARLETHYLTEHGIDMYGEVLVTNRYGATIAMTDRSSDYRQNDEEWWQATRASVHHVSDVEYDASSDMYGLPVCYSVVDGDGEFIGIIRAFVGVMEVIAETQFEAENFESTEVKVVSSSWTMIYSSIAYRIFEDVSSKEYIGHIQGESGYFKSVEGGRERLYAYTVSPGYLEYEGQSWIVIMSHDEEEVLAGVTSLGDRIMAVSYVFLMLFVAVAFALSASVTRPAAAVRDAASRMARGDLGARVEVRSRDELGDLGLAFNDMASELQELYDDLEAKVQERSRDVDAANRKLQLLGSITRHDALNQLAVLRGWLSMVEEGAADPAVKEYVAKVKAASETLEEQLKFTGTYEKIGVTKPEWVDAKLALDSNLPGLDLKGARVVNDLAGLVVHADPMFPKVLRNLADNSVKHGKGTTAVSFSYEERPEGLTIVVADDGGGVPAELKPRLFERPRDAKGRVGYGLYLSKAILDITGMTIRETGTPGKGARFEITVPPGRYRLSMAPSKARRR
ncbi:MAG: sensor histidine kinase [Candidatus Thermoplasmatota archaeon]